MLALLKRFDPEAYANRWYLVMVQPTLLHSIAVICAWGSRENEYQRLKFLPMGTEAEAEALAAKIVAAKLKRGYEPVEL
ncbi:MAG: WGR domain-containing protein [Anaerolineae bacterium]|nr:WGR domain-containing protein [Anaerolineae bacterium]